MSSDYRRRQKDAIERIADELGIVLIHKTETLEAAAAAIAWRNKRMLALEKQVVSLGGWPWEKDGDRNTGGSSKWKRQRRQVGSSS